MTIDLHAGGPPIAQGSTANRDLLQLINSEFQIEASVSGLKLLELLDFLDVKKPESF